MSCAPFFIQEKDMSSNITWEQLIISNVRNDAIQPPLCCPSWERPGTWSAGKYTEVLSYKYSGAAIIVFRGSKFQPLECVPGGWRIMVVGILESVQPTGINGLSYRVHGWSFRLGWWIWTSYGLLLTLSTQCASLTDPTTVTNNNPFRLPSVKY